MHHAGLGQYDEGVRRMILAVPDHLFRAADLVGKIAHDVNTLGVSDHGGIGILNSASLDRFLGEEDVGVATAGPETHRTTGLSDDPLTEVLIGDEKDLLVIGHVVDDLYGVSTRTDDIAEGLHAS